MKKWMLILSCLFISAGLAMAQTTTISGTVVDDTGETVIGASVVVKGTTVGTITNVDGAFTINIPSGKSTLVFSLLGMKTKEVQALPNMRVVMQSDTELLDEVIVVAYGTSTKGTFTGSASVVKADAIQKIPVTSFEKALQGASPGIQVASLSAQPGAETTVRIRGVGAISGTSNPLYVIDGVPIQATGLSKVANNDVDNGDVYGTTSSPLATLNPNDIESVTILKDASSAALYGSRAANGVILITTKKGKTGEGKISFRSQFGVSSIMSDRYKTLSGADHYKHYWNGYLTENMEEGMNQSAAAIAANTSVQQLYRRNPYNVANPLDANGDLVDGAQLMIDNNWRDALYQTAKSQEYDLSFSGGNNQGKYFVSLGYLNQEGVVVSSNFERYSMRVNLDTQVKKWAKVGVNSTFSMSKQDTPAGNGGGSSALVFADDMPNTVPIYDYDSDFNLQYDKDGDVMYNYTNPLYNDMNPVAFASKDIYKTKTYRAIVSPYLDLNFIEGLNWRTSLSADYTNMDETRWYNKEHGNGKSANGRLSKYAIWDLNLTFSSTASYDFVYEKDHHFNVLAGFEAYKNRYNYQHAQGTQFPVFDLKELNVAANPQEVNSKTDKEFMVSYLGRLNYDYQGKYYGSFSLRRDGSSRFGKDHKYGTFWSLAASWRITEEDFMAGFKDWLYDAKLRVSYGTNGSKENIGRYSSLALFRTDVAYDGKPGAVHDQVANPDLRWELSKNTNIGIDFNLFGRLTGSVEYYLKKSEDLLLKRPLAPSSGLLEKIENIGEMKNDGIEIELKSVNIQTRDLVWETSFNISHNRNKITSFPDNQQVVGSKIRTKGYSVYEFYMPEWAGVDPETGNPQWYKDVLDADQNIVERELTSTYNSATKYKLGSALPKVYGGLNNSVTYKGFDFSFLITYSFGGKVYDGYMANYMHDGNRSGAQMIKESLNSWTPENKYTNVPKFVPESTSNSNQMSSRFLYDSDNIKFKNISLGYTLPSDLTRKFYVDNLRLYASVDNLYFWHLDKDFKGYDADLGGIEGYMDGRGTMWPSRTFLFGLSIDF